jgi:(1->4)-alpha-D-glucan 1-alpha-D-glucosylmutase
MEDGAVKLYLTRQALHFRRHHRELFLTGEYRALAAGGPWADQVCAFARVRGAAAAVVIVPRLLARRDGEALPLGRDYWNDTRVTVPVAPGMRLRDVFTGRVVDAVADGDSGAVVVGDTLTDFPVSLLEVLE